MRSASAVSIRWRGHRHPPVRRLVHSLAYSRSPRSIPLRLKVQRTVARSGLSPDSHDGKALLHILDTFRATSCSRSARTSCDIATGILNLQERQRIALLCGAIRSSGSSPVSYMCRATVTTRNCGCASRQSWRRRLPGR
jgi:NAD-specific glutamate dehydrogenase